VGDGARARQTYAAGERLRGDCVTDKALFGKGDTGLCYMLPFCLLSVKLVVCLLSVKMVVCLLSVKMCVCLQTNSASVV